MTRALRTTSTAIAAIVVLVVIAVGIPLGLIALAGSPIPHALPTLEQARDALTRPEDGQLLLGVLKYAGWAGWAWFLLSVVANAIAQLAAAARNRRAGATSNVGRRAGRAIPLEVARTSVPKLVRADWVGRLVAAALALGTVATAAPGVALAGQAPLEDGPRTTPTANGPSTTPAPITPRPDITSDTKSVTKTVTTKTTKVVTVEKGDTLSGIAKDEYGTGSKWGTLFQANKGAKQAGGHLEDPDLIQPGLKLTVPGKTTTVTRTITVPAPKPAQTPQTTPESTGQAGPSTSSTTPTPPLAPPSTNAPRPGSVQAGQGDAAPSAPTRPAPSITPAPAAAQTISSGGADDSTPIVRTIAGLASITAAGALTLIRLRRARQARTRKPGQSLALPAGDAAVVEAQIRAAADPLTVLDVDTALRALAHNADPGGLPGVRAARITTDAIELYLVDAATALPEPFTQLEPGVWTLNREDLTRIERDALQDTIAPYPAMVTLGHDDDNAHLLVNLEELRALALTGHPETTAEVMHALALELLAAQWADTATITLVGLLPDLVDALEVGHVTYVDDLNQILVALEHQHQVAAAEYARAGITNPTAARAAGMDADMWTPHIVLTAAPPTPAQSDRIRAILNDAPRTAIASVMHTDTPLGEWALRVTSPTEALLDPAGIPLTPQRLDEATRAGLVDTFRAASQPHLEAGEWATGVAGETPLAEIPDALPEPATGADDDVDQAAVDHVEDDQPEPGTDPMDDPEFAARIARRREIALLPGVRGPDTDELAAIIDPERDLSHLVDAIPTATRTLPEDQPVLRLLGAVRLDNPTGPKPTAPGTALKILTHLALAPGGHHAELDQAVWPGRDVRTGSRASSLAHARKWVGDTPDGRPYLALHSETGGYRLDADLATDWALFTELTGPRVADTDTQDLADGLHLVYGKPLSKPAIAFKVDYAAQIIDRIVAVSHELGARYLTTGKPRAASWAIGKGLAVAPENEVLWRDLLKATAKLPNHEEQLDTVIRDLRTQMDALEADLDPETEQLIADLTNPTHHRVSA